MRNMFSGAFYSLVLIIFKKLKKDFLFDLSHAHVNDALVSEADTKR